MILLAQHIAKMLICCEVISSFVKFAVLVLGAIILKKHFILLSFITFIFDVFCYYTSIHKIATKYLLTLPVIENKRPPY